MIYNAIKEYYLSFPRVPLDLEQSAIMALAPGLKLFSIENLGIAIW